MKTTTMVSIYKELAELEDKYREDRKRITEKYRYLDGHYGIKTNMLKKATAKRAQQLWSITQDEDRLGIIKRNYNKEKQNVSVYIQPGLGYHPSEIKEQYDILLYVPLVGKYIYLRSLLDIKPTNEEAEEIVRELLPNVGKVLFSNQRLDV